VAKLDFSNFQKLNFFANKNGKLWGFHLQKPHNFPKNLHRGCNTTSFFANKNGKLWGFYLQKPHNENRLYYNLKSVVLQPPFFPKKMEIMGFLAHFSK